MEAVIDVDGIAYCSIEIEGSSMPPSANFVDTIFIQDGGFGTPNPVLQLILSDATGTLDADLNLQDGTLITIKLAKEREKVVVRKFRVFYFDKQTAADGPKLKVTCIYDSPQWIAGVFTESFRGSSSDAMSQMAAAAGLGYDGPGGTDDVMTWLNVNRTRTSFSEDVAMRAYASGQSCMARLLTLEGIVKFKDLFKELQAAPKWTYHQNTDESTATGTPIPVRETRNASVSGLATHIMNYGQTQYNHSLDVAGQTTLDGVDAPVFGTALPINADVKSQVSGRGARINYTGWDTGTEPKPASNIHHKYEDAQYQNLRFLGLLSERIRILTDEYTDVQPFDTADYKHSDAVTGEFEEKKALAGKWIVGGRTMWIKSGHKYSEIHFLYRPTIQEAGATAGAGAEAPAGEQNAKANAAGDMDQEIANVNTPSVPDTGEVQPTPVVAQPAAQSAKQSLESMDRLALQNSLDNPPILGKTADGATLAEEAQLRTSLASMRSAGGPLAEMSEVGDVGELDKFKTLKRFNTDVVEYFANITPEDVAYAVQNPEQFKASSIDRITNYSGDVIGMDLHNIVAAATGEHYSPGAIVGDVLAGGIWRDNLQANGVNPDAINIPGLPGLPQNAYTEAGAKFLYDATGLGMTPEGVMLNPRQFADSVERWSRETNPQEILMRDGFRAFESTFGAVTPQEAETIMGELGILAAEVALKYTENELLYDGGLQDHQIEQIGRDIAFIFGDPHVTPIVDTVGKVTTYGDHTDVQTNSEQVTWAAYYSMGASTQSGSEQWKYPYSFPEAGSTSEGNNTGGWPNNNEGFDKW